MSTISIHGQSSIQMSYGKETYKIYKWVAFSGADTSIAIVNCKNTLDMEKLNECCNCDVRYMGGVSILQKVMKSVFSQEKQKVFATTVTPQRIRYALYYDAANGQILNVEFELFGVKLSAEDNSPTAVTLKEIYQLEIQLKSQQLKIEHCDCSKFKYGYDFYSLPLQKMVQWTE